MQCIPWKCLAMLRVSLILLSVCRTCCWVSLMFVLFHLPGVCIWFLWCEPFPESLKHLCSRLQHVSIHWRPAYSSFMGKRWRHSTNDRYRNTLQFGSSSTGGRSCPSFHPQRQPPNLLLFFMCWGRRGARREISLMTLLLGMAGCLIRVGKMTRFLSEGFFFPGTPWREGVHLETNIHASVPAGHTVSAWGLYASTQGRAQWSFLQGKPSRYLALDLAVASFALSQITRALNRDGWVSSAGNHALWEVRRKEELK